MSSGRRKSFSDMLEERKETRRSREALAAKEAEKPPLKEHPIFGKFFKMSGMFTKPEIVMKMREEGLDPAVLDMDPEKPYVDPRDPVKEVPVTDAEAAAEASSPKTRRGVKAIFDVFDRDGCGMLSTVTLGAAFHKLGVMYKPDLVKTAMDEFDADGNGKLDFGEFMELLSMMQDSAELAPEETAPLHKFNDKEVKQLRKSFDDIDQDGGGSLDRDELLLATKHALGPHDDDVSEDDIRMMLDKFDTDGDGNMDFDEFLTMMSALDATRKQDGAAEGVARGADQIQELIRENLKRAREKGRKSDRVRQVGVSAAIKKFEAESQMSLEEVSETAAAACKAAGGDADDAKKASREGRDAAVAFLNKMILKAAEKGPPAEIKAAVKRGGDPNCVALEEEMNQATALMMALKANRKDEAVTLIECGADASLRDTRNESALIAAASGHTVAEVNVIEKLIAAGGDIDAATDRGVTPVHAAAAFGRNEALGHLLKKCGATIPPKEEDHVAQLEVRTADGLTPLMKAAQMGQQPSVELLIKFGAEINALDNSGRTALDWAEQTDRKAIVDLMKKSNAERGSVVKRKAQQEALAAKKAAGEGGSGAASPTRPQYGAAANKVVPGA